MSVHAFAKWNGNKNGLRNVCIIDSFVDSLVPGLFDTYGSFLYHEKRHFENVPAFGSSLCSQDRCYCCCFPSCTHLKQSRKKKRKIHSRSVPFFLSFFLFFWPLYLDKSHRCVFFCLIIQHWQICIGFASFACMLYCVVDFLHCYVYRNMEKFKSDHWLEKIMINGHSMDDIRDHPTNSTLWQYNNFQWIGLLSDEPKK